MSWLRRDRVQLAGLLCGPLLALVVYLLLPDHYATSDGSAVALHHGARATIAVMAWMATWWLTEAIDISATALLPIAAFPLLGVLTVAEATAPYGSDIIFLFMGGFVIALSMQRWGLDRRVALFTLRIVGSRPASIIGGFMGVTAALSMWVSNTATAAMMLPIAISVIDLVLEQHRRAPLRDGGLPGPDQPGRNFALSLMLGIAYAASIGGIATIIGSPPNGILVQFVALEYGREISFAEWLLIGGPVALVFLPIAWVLITWVLYPIRIGRIEGGSELFEREYRDLGPMSRGEWATLIVFSVTALLWVLRPLLAQWTLGSAHEPWRPFARLSDGGVAIAAALALFVIPVKDTEPRSAAPADTAARTSVRPGRQFAMDWPTAEKLPWGILILFGGGLSLAAAVQGNGVAEFIAANTEFLRGMPTIALVFAVTTGVIFLTELTSNTATTATLVPILAGLSTGLAVMPEMLIIPATIAASCAFMMPVATPPNAIVFGSGYVTIPGMAKAGFWLNLIGAVIVTTVLYLIVLPLLGRS